MINKLLLLAGEDEVPDVEPIPTKKSETPPKPKEVK